MAAAVTHNIYEDPDEPGDWIVEAVDDDGNLIRGADGGIYRTLFSGGLNEARAQEYSNFKEHQDDSIY